MIKRLFLSTLVALFSSFAVMASDTLVVEMNPDPEWYVSPDAVVVHRAPRHAMAAASDQIDSVLTFDIDSVLVESAVYEYGDTVRTLIWNYNSDGSRYGKSKEESKTVGGKELYSASFEWDFTTNDWAGKEKFEYQYNASGKLTSHRVYCWENHVWADSLFYTYAYDEAGREKEYISRIRKNGSFGYDKRRVKGYNAAGTQTLEEQYSYNSAASKWEGTSKWVKEYDGSNLINDEQYNGYDLANAKWIGSTKKVYEYTSGKQTMLATYTWGADDWVGTTKEIWGYTSGTKTYYEKQTWSGGAWVSVYEEKWAYANNKQTYYEKMNWSNGAWVGVSKEKWEYNGPSNKQTLHEKYGWANDDWAISLQENSGFDAAGNNNLIENYSFSNGVKTGTKKIEYIYTNTKWTTSTTYAWVEGVWVYSQKKLNNSPVDANTVETCTYNYDKDNGKWVAGSTRKLNITLSDGTEVINQTWSNGNWINHDRSTTTKAGGKTIQEASFQWKNDRWEGTSRKDWSYVPTNASDPDTIKTYTPSGTDWVYSNRTVNTFNSNKKKILTHNAKWEEDKWKMTSMNKWDILDQTFGDGHRETLNASYQCTADSVWTGIQKDTVTYSKTGNKLYEARYESWANNDWVPSYKIESKYDDKDRKILNERYDWIANSWQGHYKYEYEYDNKGQTLMTASYLNWNTSADTWIGNTKYKYVYDDKGRKTSQISYTWINGGWGFLFSYTYKYDAAGNEIEQIVQNYSNNEWTNANKYEKEYRGSLVLKDNMYSWINDEWKFYSRNESYYDNDAEGKLRREIRGSWSNGVLVSFYDNHYFYTSDPKLYMIRFVNYNDAELSSGKVQEGLVPTYAGKTPTRPADAQYTYTFEGWSPTVEAVTGEATYKATYSTTTNQYTIVFVDEDKPIESNKWDYGATPTCTEPTKAATAEFTYTFAGWTPTVEAVTGEATYKATYSTTTNQYTIAFVDEDDTPIESNKWDYGATPTCTEPTKAATAEFTYTFAGWTPAIEAVTGEATYKATYNGIKRSYTITWLNDNGTQIDQTTVEYGEMPTHSDPVKPSDSEYDYSFAGWTPEVIAVDGEATYIATFTATPKHATSLSDVSSSVSATKLLINGTIYILRDGKLYSLDGSVVE